MEEERIYKINLKKDPEGGYVVTVPALPGCVTWGKNQKQALEMAEEAIEGFLEALAKADRKLPTDRRAARLHESLVHVRISATP
ncbi:MAG: type II toxin-antitoxin system HicB family antitoxin [Patescibacteria group bacterium]